MQQFLLSADVIASTARLPRSWRLLLCLLLCSCSGSSVAGDAARDALLHREGLAFADGPQQDLPAGDAAAGDLPADSGRDGPAPPAGQPCSLPDYAGWRCLPLRVISPRHGDAPFQVEIRWNLAAQAPQASALWVMGNTGAGKFRSEYNGQAIQDKLAQVDQLRSLEVEFVDPPDAEDLSFTGGYFRLPRQGYPDASWVYAEIVKQLRQLNLAAGGWLVHIGISNGSMMGAAALAHHQLGQLVQRYILIAGPFAADLGTECADSTASTFMGQISAAAPDIRRLQDLWNGWTTHRYCQLGAATAVPSYDSRSLLGSTAATSYPGVSLTVLLGDADEFGPWILASNDNWYSQVTPQSKRRYVFAGATHLTLGSSGQPITAATQRALDTLYEHARRPPLQEPSPKPALIFSKTAGGPPATQFSSAETLYGRTVGIGPAAQGCLEAPTARGLCLQLANWSTMPNSDWQYSAASGQWTAAVSLSAFSPGVYHGWWRDAATEKHTDRVSLVIQ